MWYARELSETRERLFWKGVWGCQGEPWGLGLKGWTSKCLLVPNIVTSQKFQKRSRSWGNAKKHWNGYKCKRRM